MCKYAVVISILCGDVSEPYSLIRIRIDFATFGIGWDETTLILSSHALSVGCDTGSIDSSASRVLLVLERLRHCYFIVLEALEH
jgi:hypothetical protein